METNTKMTRLSATATIAALLLLAIAQGFGATSPTKSTVKSSPKIASKSTAKPYHITARNQFHMDSAKALKAQARHQKKAQASKRGQHGKADALALSRMNAQATARKNADATIKSAGHRGEMTHAIKPRRNAANPPPAGTLGFVSATQIADQGENNGQVQAATIGGLDAFITVVDINTATPPTVADVCVYSEVQANGDGTFTPLVPTAPAVLTPKADGTCNNNFVVGDVNGDGNTDILEADQVGGTVSITVFLSNGDGTFTATAASPFVISTTGGTGGTLVPDATTPANLDIVFVDDSCDWGVSCPSNIITVTGNGDGTFNAPSAPVPLVPSGTAVGGGYNVLITDFDGDGIVDVAEYDYNTDQLNTYLSSTSYAGLPSVTPDGNEDACTSTFGSLTGSSGLPAIVTTFCDNDILVVYNNSAGTLSEATYYPVVVTQSSTPYTYPYSATIADVNGDGNGDVVVTNEFTGDITVLLGNGSGGLALTSVGYAVGGYPFGAAIVEDLNGDGLADILVADDNQSLVWMAGFGDGTFQAARDYYTPVPENGYAYGYSIASGDFNGDGFADLVVGNFGDQEGAGITVFLSNPDGSLQPGVNYGASGYFGYATVADFNGDGNLDIAASSYEGFVQIFTGTGTGTFVVGPLYGTAGEGEGIVAAQFNSATASGFNDLAVADYNSNVYVLLNDGTGGFMSAVPYGVTNGGEQLATGQLTAGGANPSGFNDLVVAEWDGVQFGVLLGNGDGTFTAAPDVVTGASSPFGVTLADVSGDGIVDIVGTDDNQNIMVATGFGDGTFPNALQTLVSSTIVTNALATLNPYNSPDPWSVQVTDVNGDGFPDLVYTNEGYGTVGVIFGTGAGTATVPTFYDAVEFPVAAYANGITVADINGDGTPDVGATAFTQDDVVSLATTLINANGTGAAANYTLTSNASFINIADGGTGTVTITLTPVNFYSGTVTFSCGGLPLDVTCAFAPATLTPLGNAPLQTTLTVTTAAPHGALRMPADANPHQGRTSLLACLTGMGLFGLLLSGDWKNKRNRRVGILLGILVLGMMFSLVGCSSSTTPGTPVGAQTIQVTGTGSDGTTNSVNVTINVF
jgi:hypothetical protein